VRPRCEGFRSSDRRSGLGRGLGVLISSAVVWFAATQLMLAGTSWIFTGYFEGRGLPVGDHALRIGQVLLAAAASVSLRLSRRAAAWLFLLSLSVGLLLLFFVENWAINFLGQPLLIVFLALSFGTRTSCITAAYCAKWRLRSQDFPETEPRGNPDEKACKDLRDGGVLPRSPSRRSRPEPFLRMPIWKNTAARRGDPLETRAKRFRLRSRGCPPTVLPSRMTSEGERVRLRPKTETTSRKRTSG